MSRALVLGARGAVGRAAVTALRAVAWEVAEGSRTAADERLRIDLGAPEGRRRLHAAAASGEYAAVLNASGVEDARIGAVADQAALVDISATAAYLDALAEAVPPDARVVLGAGIAPGLSTILAAALDARQGDEIDVAVMLGSGERHGPAAVEWTAGLLGAAIHDPVEGGTLRNLVRRRRMPDGRGRRIHLRADFPDQLLLGHASGLRIRSWLALDSRVSTAALGVAAHLPGAVGAAVVRRAPHLGGSAWRVAALNRRTGELREARGEGQSAATGRLAALAVRRVVERDAARVGSMAGLVSETEALAELGGGGG
ncbi:hypothetical protein [Homoserinibacter sp. YIM 151385]|uniref:hypothetical protein n=1 Tax=Homoserinibacter sp. YIM 151385 TaxID=2985506 RepID=UPI0022F0D1A1|nr:hypothetical protein [Homoserinibacter sp. YIM 151385]WBU36731.1 hypothetical protein OF852_07210 [Homoserinibacter sp. YIM 151385]